MVIYASLFVAVAEAALFDTPAMAAKHKFSCYDLAWQSQEMKDCLANPSKYEHMAAHKHRAMHKAAMHKKKKMMKKEPMKKAMPEKQH